MSCRWERNSIQELVCGGVRGQSERGLTGTCPSTKVPGPPWGLHFCPRCGHRVQGGMKSGEQQGLSTYPHI